ncbi:NAD(P)-dependent alcohol dehydrogenase [Nocardia harenae]|uniref:NAD(P)-dependent alcohol dehydrogenase n=1 Tax=Nocardia harenae TaxID=358707 RepID=UPI00082CA0FF|nr:NAD(P)-dependent alcohol dehydrogenase [Nocardia harenae]
MHTTAALSYGPESPFTPARVELSDPRENEVLVRIVAAGICHTDLTSKAYSAPDTPAVYGHEGAGIVEAIGAAVTGIAVGDKVLISYNSCGSCARCAAGHRAYCANFGPLNAAGARPDGTTPVSIDGDPVWSAFFGQSSFAHHAIATAENVVVVDPEVDLRIAAPMGCGFQTGAGAVLNILRPQADSSVVVFGVGGVGMAAVMAARALGARTVIAVDLSAQRRELALEVGATHAIDGAADDLVAAITEITGGGASHALDTTAVPAVIANALAALDALGTLVTVGIGSPELTVNIVDLISNGKTVRGSIEGDANPAEMIPTLLNWHAEGKFPVEKIITVYPFEKINDAVADMHGHAIKPVLHLP